MVDSLVKTAGGLTTGFMGLALVGESMKMLPPEWRMQKPVRSYVKPKPMNKNVPIGLYRPIKPYGARPMPKMSKPVRSYISPKQQTGNFIKGATGIMVGTALLGGTAGMINKL